MQTKRSKFRKPDHSCTAQELADNIMTGYLPAAAQARQEGCEPYISMDNPNFHNISPDLCDLTGQVLVLPDYSPDLHQVIEHPFGYIKHELANRLYRLGASLKDTDMQVLMDMVVDLCTQITPAQVESQLQNLKDCYEVVAAPLTEGVTIKNTYVPGVKGGRPPKRFR